MSARVHVILCTVFVCAIFALLGASEFVSETGSLQLTKLTWRVVAALSGFSVVLALCGRALAAIDENKRLRAEHAA